MSRVRRMYPSDLNDLQWKRIKEFIPKARPGGRPRKTNVRQVLNAIFFISKTGCPWRYLPKNFPNWQIVYNYYGKWARDGIIKIIHDFLVSEVRGSEGRSKSPSILIVDTQSTRAGFGEKRGYDGFKKVKGRKRSVIVDTFGLIHSVYVNTAQRGDVASVVEALNPESEYFPKKAKIPLQDFYADAGYRSATFEQVIEKTFEVKPTLKKSKTTKVCVQMAPKKWKYDTVVLESNLKPVRWIVERTFAWFNNFRRLSRDYEKKTINSEAMILISMMQLMLRRLFREKPYARWGSSA